MVTVDPYKAVLSEDLIELLDEKLAALNDLRPIPPSLMAQLKERFQVEMTYNSNAIEGNTLTLNETYWVIQEGITVKGKPLRDHLEAKNHQQALSYLYDLIEEGKYRDITEKTIKQLHYYTVQDSDPSIAGQYREVDVKITGTDHLPPSATTLKEDMKGFIKWGIRHEDDYHLVEFAARFHHRLAAIHPFVDGNGRTARLAMNLVLMKAGFPLAVILNNDRKKYYRVMRQADKGNCKDLVIFMAQAVIRSLNMYLDTVTPSKKKERLISLAEAAESCDYSQEYLSKLAKLGKLDAHKQSRNWVTTKKAVAEYVEKHGGK
jgi:Fic family protein